MADEQFRRLFPNLAATGFRITSSASFAYNCVAWAANDVHRWWDPDAGSYWPPGVPRTRALTSYIRALATIGYEPCATSDLELDFEKVALFVNAADRAVQHAARQLESGTWTSKLGILEDIVHNELTALEGEDYGTVAQILRRPRRT